MRIVTFVLFLAGLAVVPMSLIAAGDFKLESGFTLLFNSKNLDGWREKKSKDTLQGKTHAFNGRFKVEDGVLVYDPAVKGDRYIETTKEFAKDVHFKFDFKPGPKCNNDILFRGKKYDIIPGDKENKNVKEGEWHTFELRATGETLQYKINGEVVRTTAKVKVAASTLMLRAEFGAMQVKNIRVKE